MVGYGLSVSSATQAWKFNPYWMCHRVETLGLVFSSVPLGDNEG